MPVLGPWNPRKVKAKCSGCVRAQNCKQVYWKDGKCPYRVTNAQYNEWMRDNTLEHRGGKIFKEGA